jgi:hypothetical protein
MDSAGAVVSTTRRIVRGTRDLSLRTNRWVRLSATSVLEGSRSAIYGSGRLRVTTRRHVASGSDTVIQAFTALVRFASDRRHFRSPPSLRGRAPGAVCGPQIQLSQPDVRRLPLHGTGPVRPRHMRPEPGRRACPGRPRRPRSWRPGRKRCHRAVVSRAWWPPLLRNPTPDFQY